MRQIAILILLAGAGFLGVIALAAPERLAGGALPGIVHLLGWLALVGAGVVVGARVAPGAALRNALIWVAVFAALALGYRLFAQQGF